MLAESRIRAASIYPGCAWRLGIQVIDAALGDFSADATFIAQVRQSVDGQVLFELSSAENEVLAVSSTDLEIYISAEDTALCAPGIVHLDFLRTDLEEPLHLGFQLEIPVRAAITTSGAVIGQKRNIISAREKKAYSCYVPGSVIQTGSKWELTLNFASASSSIFSEDAAFLSNVINGETGEILAVLSTATGEIERVSGNVLKLTIPGGLTADWMVDVVWLDILRIDAGDPVHLGFDLEIPVNRSVTRL